MNPRRWFLKSKVAGWIGHQVGWVRTTPWPYENDGPEWTWQYVGREMTRAIREIRREP